MKPKNINFNRTASRIYMLLLLSCLALQSCKSPHSKHPHPDNTPIIFHQQYQPIQDWQAYRIFDSALYKAQLWYAAHNVKVDDIVFRHSRPKKNPYHLSKADIFDWPRLLATLINEQNAQAPQQLWHYLTQNTRSTIQSLLENQQTPSREQKITITNEINRIIDAQTLTWRGGPTAQPSKPNPRRNRQILDNRFTHSLSPFLGIAKIQTRLLLCENYNAPGHRFAIYLNSTPDKKAFPLELAHETFHVLNPHIYSWYVEGLANVFAQRFAQEMGHDFTPWQKMFAKGKTTKPYAIAYYMMSEIRQVAGDHHLKTLIYHTMPNNNTPSQSDLHINIDSWLKTIPMPKRQKIIQIIRHHGKHLKKHTTDKIGFTLPKTP